MRSRCSKGSIGHYEITQVTREVLELIITDLEKRPARCALGTKKHMLTNGIINRYLNAGSSPPAPRLPCCLENGRERAIGDEGIVVKLMREAGHRRNAAKRAGYAKPHDPQFAPYTQNASPKRGRRHQDTHANDG